MTRKFPVKESDVLERAETLATGLEANPELFPHPPAPALKIRELVKQCQAGLDAATAAKAAYREAVEGKDEHFAELEGWMKKDFRYGEDAVDYDPAKLERIGWHTRHAPKALVPPGQVRSLTIKAQGEGWLDLSWRDPADGGKVATFRIECREPGNETWDLVEIAMEHQARLSNQARGKKLEFCVLAANKAGEGEPSNTVMVVL
uniref:Fibronectin type III domain-containing protein n=1 Tax=Candidatus Kentrum sp. DK TaxID=2126562 RepID=A0A450SCT7_9GAMM|nr:MAG: Fibronectin type III domain-containing protein [Candidatus Kentron sp. DK]